MVNILPRDGCVLDVGSGGGFLGFLSQSFGQI